MKHSDVLKLLFPVKGMGGVFDQDAEIEGAHLDDLQAAADSLEMEIYPDSMSLTTEDWERLYGLEQSNLPEFQRQQNLLAARRFKPRLDKEFMKAALSAYLGYPVQITESIVFRCDDPRSLTDMDIYAFDNASIFTYLIHIDNRKITTVGYNLAEIAKVVDAIKPAHMQTTIIPDTIGFFCDDPNSLTDYTALAQ